MNSNMGHWWNGNDRVNLEVIDRKTQPGTILFANKLVELL